jgi:pyruvate/2-oxoglutarate dehydrogenase complex dihydrolipoamide dehydrogenase (E3) component
VTVVEVLPQILAGVDVRVVQQFRRIVEKEGIVFHTGRRLQSVAYSDATVRASLDDGTDVEADLMLGFFFPGAAVDPIGTAGGLA